MLSYHLVAWLLWLGMCSTRKNCLSTINRLRFQLLQYSNSKLYVVSFGLSTRLIDLSVLYEWMVYSSFDGECLYRSRSFYYSYETRLPRNMYTYNGPMSLPTVKSALSVRDLKNIKVLSGAKQQTFGIYTWLL